MTCDDCYNIATSGLSYHWIMDTKNHTIIIFITVIHNHMVTNFG